MRTFLILCLLAVPAISQNTYQDFLKAFDQAVQYDDAKGVEKALRADPVNALRHWEGLATDKKNGKDVAKVMEAFVTGWSSIYENKDVLDNYERWVGYLTAEKIGFIKQAQSESYQVYQELTKFRGDNTVGRKSWDELKKSATGVAEKLSNLGHKIDAADAWVVVANIAANIPQRSVQDRRDTVFALERFLEERNNWGWTFDPPYNQNKDYLKAEKARLEEAIKEAEKREADGYEAGVEGVAGLVMPDSKPTVLDLTFVPLKTVPDDDMFVSGGPVAPFWIEVRFHDEATDEGGNPMKRGDGALYDRFNWFGGGNLYVVQEGLNKYALATTSLDETVPIEASAKPEPCQFEYVDANGNKQPYSMAFFLGGDRVLIGTCEQNLAPTKKYTPMFYKSTSSWTTQINGEEVTFYDDSGDAVMFEHDPMAVEYKIRTAGDPEGTVMPMLDSMRIGKRGARIPFSEFVKVGDKWFYLHASETDPTKPAVQPLNPDYLKTGTVTFKWDMGRKAAPQFVVIQGEGTYAAARFDVTQGKGVEVPAGSYRVLYGRIVAGKGARTQVVQIAGGDMESFEVEAGKEFELVMGRGMHYSFPFDVDGRQFECNLERLVMKDDLGCTYFQFHNVTQAPELVYAPAVDSKRMKPIESLVAMTDPNFTRDAGKTIGRVVATLPMQKGATDGSMKLKVELPAPSGAVGLSIKKHPLFPKVTTKLFAFDGN